MIGRRIDYLTEPEKRQCRRRSEMAISGIEVLLGNLGLVTNKGDITEKYRTIAQYIGLVQEGSSHYNYFIPTEQDIVFMLRLSNHNNENEALYNLHEKKGRPDIRYIIPFQGNGYTPLFNGTFCEARHYVYNYPIWIEGQPQGDCLNRPGCNTVHDFIQISKIYPIIRGRQIWLVFKLGVIFRIPHRPAICARQINDASQFNTLIGKGDIAAYSNRGFTVKIQG